MLNRVLVAAWDDAEEFDCEQPYAVISFVARKRRRRRPRLRDSVNRVGHLVTAADDCYENSALSIALTPRQALRIAKFVDALAPHIETLLIHCRQGLGRSPGAAIAIARAFGLPWKPFLDIEDAAPNGHITLLICRAFERLDYAGGSSFVRSSLRVTR